MMPTNAPLLFSALLLAGGRSSRMGKDKALLPWKGRPLWQAQLEKLHALGPKYLMVACREEQGLHHHTDEIPAQTEWLFDPPGEELAGPLGAIDRGLAASRTPLVVLAVDLPAMTPEFLRERLLAHAPAGKGVFFTQGRFFEPLAGLYVPAMLPLIHQALLTAHYGVQGVIHHAVNAGVAEVLRLEDTDRALFLNANTPDEWAQANPRAHAPNEATD